MASIRWKISGLWCQTKTLSDSPVVGLRRDAVHWEWELSVRSGLLICSISFRAEKVKYKESFYCGCRRLIMDTCLSPRV